MRFKIVRWIILYIIIFLIVGYWQSTHVAYEWTAEVTAFGKFKAMYLSQEFFISNIISSSFVFMLIYGLYRLKKRK